MATLDELRLQQLLRPLEGPGGIESLNPLAFQYQNQFYPNQMQYQYPPRTDISPTQDFYPPRTDISPTQDFYPERNFVNAPQNFYPPDLTTLRGLDMNRFQGVSDMSIIDETTNDEQSQEYIDQVKKSQGGGIGGLLKFLLGLAVPGAGLLMNLGQSGFNKLRGGFDKGLGSLRNLNQRIQGSNFGRATSLADYFDMRNYGGYQGRENARARTMAQARGIQKKIDTGEYRRTAADNVIDRGRGDRPGGANYSAPSRPSRTSPQSGMQAERTRSRDLGSMRGGVGR